MLELQVNKVVDPAFYTDHEDILFMFIYMENIKRNLGQTPKDFIC